MGFSKKDHSWWTAALRRSSIQKLSGPQPGAVSSSCHPVLLSSERSLRAQTVQLCPRSPTIASPCHLSQVTQQACTPGTAESPGWETAESGHFSFSLSLGKAVFLDILVCILKTYNLWVITALPSSQTIQGPAINIQHTPHIHTPRTHTTHTSHMYTTCTTHIHMHIPHTPLTLLTPHILTLSFPSQPKFYPLLLCFTFFLKKPTRRCSLLLYSVYVLFTFMPVFYCRCWSILLLSDRPSGNFPSELTCPQNFLS